MPDRIDDTTNKEVIAIAKSYGVKISEQAIIDINGRIRNIIKRATERAKANRRKTIMPHDL